jgi:hypothetical protein
VLTTWRGSGPDAYTVTVEEISNGKSKELWSMVMHRSSPPNRVEHERIPANYGASASLRAGASVTPRPLPAPPGKGLVTRSKNAEAVNVSVATLQV